MATHMAGKNVSASVFKNKVKRARHTTNTEIGTASYQYFLYLKSEQIRVC